MGRTPGLRPRLGTELESNVIYFMSGVIAFALKQRPAAKSLGIELPLSLLVRADELIE